MLANIAERVKFLPRRYMLLHRDRRGLRPKNMRSAHICARDNYTMGLISALSTARFARYAQWAAGNVDLAERLYTYNVHLSERFYPVLHGLEIALRNRSADALEAAFGPAWLDHSVVCDKPYLISCIADARTVLKKTLKPDTTDNIVAELSFGFWAGLYSANQQRWAALRPIFRSAAIQRKHVASRLNDIRRLRNRIAHHEPILAMPLSSLKEQMIELTKALSIETFRWVGDSSQLLLPPTDLITVDPITGSCRFDTALLRYLSS